MDRTRVVVRCAECRFEATHDRLRTARETLATHEADTGHAVDWRIESLAPGVERAGADAGVCGLPARANADSPLVDPGDADR
ncbi:hypothetical protein DQW50_12290 [Halorubrum sp. 48-1-W]|uniref:DUF7542 family protein n=1 Tax=Halorubrum sp. 48-1-W TaxID=2249761 RepID=UPI000DCD7592|nr:hypothetical protein [Halorubrum sp. 48-1-W]RAW44787.1 hypothetical protein DQW50_12290 [Halorubrum sp. 48-1-W]